MKGADDQPQPRRDAFAFLERTFPVVSLPLVALIVLNTDQPWSFVGFYLGFGVFNVVTSRIAIALPSRHAVPAEIAKTGVNVVIIGAVTYAYGTGNFFWTLHFFTLFRNFVALRGRTEQRLLSAVLAISPGVAAWAGGASLGSALLPPAVLAVPTTLATVIFAFLRDHLELLRQVERRYERLAHVSPVGTIELTAEGECKVVNERWTEITGLLPAASVGTGWRRVLGAEDRERLLDPTHARGPATATIVSSATDSPRWVIAQSTIERDEAGEITGYVCSFTDITEQWLAQQELAETQTQLVRAARLAGMADVATGVLHNVGNVLNSVSVTASGLSQAVRQSRVAMLGRLRELLESRDDLGEFFAHDPRGAKVLPLLCRLDDALTAEHDTLCDDLDRLHEHVAHVVTIVRRQQAFARCERTVERCNLVDVLEEALLLSCSATSVKMEVQRKFAEVPQIETDRHKVLQILTNLLTNARQALSAVEPDARSLELVVDAPDPEQLTVSVIDSGVGIAPENLERVFTQGFSTKKDGHGFGLHNSFMSARELHGELRCHSDGPGHGARFTLSLPTRAAA